MNIDVKDSGYEPDLVTESEKVKSDFSLKLAALKKEFGHNGAFKTRHLGDVSADHIGQEPVVVIPFGIGSPETGMTYLKISLGERQARELQDFLGVDLGHKGKRSHSPDRGEPFEPEGPVNDRVAQLMEQSGEALVVRVVNPLGGDANRCTVNFVVRPANDAGFKESTTGTRLHFDLTLPQAMALQRDLGSATD